MKNLKHLLAITILINVSTLTSQTDSLLHKPAAIKVARFTIEPAIGIHPMPIADVRLSNVIQMNVTRRLNLIAYSYYARHNAFRRRFNYINTDYSFSIAQMIG